MTHPLERLVLGAAQLGMSYGIANHTGQPSFQAAHDLIAAGWQHGLRWFDTAQAYGTSEAVLGEVFAQLGVTAEASVVTKLAPEVAAENPAAVAESVRGSLCRLRTPHIGGLMLHREAQLDSWTASIRQSFEAAKEAGLIQNAGVSVYSAERALEALAQPGIDMIQVAANVFDRRIQRAGVFERARELGKTVFVRSIYLQGLALMSPEAAPSAIPRAVEAVAALDQFCRERRLDRQRFAIDFIRTAAPEARLILGAETREQMEENCVSFAGATIDPTLHAEWMAHWPDDVEPLIDPRNWKS